MSKRSEAQKVFDLEADVTSLRDLLAEQVTKTIEANAQIAIAEATNDELAAQMAALREALEYAIQSITGVRQALAQPNLRAKALLAVAEAAPGLLSACEAACESRQVVDPHSMRDMRQALAAYDGKEGQPTGGDHDSQRRKE